MSTVPVHATHQPLSFRSRTSFHGQQKPFFGMLTKTAFPLLAFLIISASRAGAQTYEQVAPQEPPNPETPTMAPPPEERMAASDDDRQLLASLRGLVFLDDAADLQPSGVDAPGVTIDGIPLLDTSTFREQMEPFLGEPLTMGGLREITHTAIRALRDADRPLTDVIVPEQSLQTGVIQLIVIEGRLGQVRTEGSRWFSSERLKAAVRAEPGGGISGSELMADLVWINQNPFRRVDLVFAPGTAPGEADVVLRSQERLPVRVYAGYDDSGTPLTGENRWYGGVNWGNVFGWVHQLNYQFTASSDAEKMEAHSGSYLIPLPWRDTLTLMGSYGTSRPDIPYFELDGKTWQMSARYQTSLPDWRGVKQGLTAGFDVKRSNNNLAFGGTEVFDQESDIVQAVLTYSASLADNLGTTSGEVSLYLSPGEIGGRNNDAAFRENRSRADATYAYLRVQLSRSTRLPSDFRWVARLQGQLASENLLGSEQLGFGGASSLRGYDEREVNGDNGIIFVNELHTPILPLARRLGITGISDQLRFLAFLDAGISGLHHPLPGEARSHELLSAGLGLHYSIGSHLIARASYGWQLQDSGLSPTGRDARAHFSLTVAY